MSDFNTSLIDTHCHLDFPEFDSNRLSLLQHCQHQGFVGLVVPGVAYQSWDRLRQLAEQYPLVQPAYGLHPYFVADHKEVHLAALDQQLQRFNAVAVGEIGLDFFHGHQTEPLQTWLFKEQLAVARNHRLPVIVHARKSQDLIIKQIKKAGFQFGGVMHAYSGSQQQAEQLLDLGFKFGFGGAATYPRATKLQSLLTALPLDSLLLETDAPDMAPVFARGETNSPANLPRIAEILAQVMALPVDALYRANYNNAVQLFGLDVSNGDCRANP